jgi:hypothetical protein
MQARFNRIDLRDESRSKTIWLSIVVLTLAFLSTSAEAQSSGKANNQGELTVTATVVASATLIMEPNGQQRLVIANALDARDNVSRLVPAENSTNKRDSKSLKVAEKADHHK